MESSGKRKQCYSNGGANSNRKITCSLANIDQNSVCSGCFRPITDAYLLGALSTFWHEDCLICDICQKPLWRQGNRFYYRSMKRFCVWDYVKTYGKPGQCSKCDKVIPPTEYVLKFTGEISYHIECFSCTICNRSFCVGESFFLKGPKEILCMDDCKGQLGTSIPDMNYGGSRCIDSVYGSAGKM